MTATTVPPRLRGLTPFMSVPSDGTVHVWRVSLNHPTELLSALQSSLSADEQAHAQRFIFERDRRRYVIAHAALRKIIAAYLRTDAASVEFDVGMRGKPSLRGPVNEHGLRFNMSHSEDLALVAVTREREVGVDVEYVRDVADDLSIAQHFFCKSEQALLGAADGPERRSMFFRLWTRKEALIKATGDGLWLPLNEVDVSAAEDNRPHTLAVMDGRGVQRHLRVQDLWPASSYAAAIAVEVEDTPTLDVRIGSIELALLFRSSCRK
jgi:4'-phosphopantetheinyl transferase